MGTLKTMLAVAGMACLLAGCQQNEYKIQGTAEGIADGDTIYLTVDAPDTDPLQKVVVKNGAFEIQGKVDSVMLCAVFAPNQPEMNASLFLEPGTIKVHLSKEQAKSTVSGTKANDAWQQLNDTLAVYNSQMQKLVAVFYEQDTDSARQTAAMEQLKKLESVMMQRIVEAAEHNADNEMGFFVVTHFEDDSYFTPDRRRAVIERMPSQFRNRAAIKEIEAFMNKAQAIEKGHKIEDFSLPTPDGTSQSVMEIVRNNKLTILDFWASWCGPCRQEMPVMRRIYENYHSKGLEIIGISLDDNKEAWVAAVSDMKLVWPQISDLKGWQSAAAEQFNVRAIPHVIIVDQNGTIIEKDLRGEPLETFIGEKLK
jgi:thiol-disulfide isomerase/thioredoxin